MKSSQCLIGWPRDNFSLLSHASLRRNSSWMRIVLTATIPVTKQTAQPYVDELRKGGGNEKLEQSTQMLLHSKTGFGLLFFHQYDLCWASS